MTSRTFLSSVVALGLSCSAALVAHAQATAPPPAKPAATAPAKPAAAPPAAATPAAPPAAKPAAPASPTRLAFDFKDPKGVNAVGFLLDSTLEPIFGTGTGIEGSVEFDALNPMAATGVLRLDAKALRTTNEAMTGVLHNADWLDVANHPTIEVRLVSMETVEPLSASTFKVQAKAKVTVKGKTVETTIPVLASYLPGRLGDRVRGATGDLLVLRSRFTVKRSDFDLKMDSSTEVVADEILLTAAVVGMRKTG